MASREIIATINKYIALLNAEGISVHKAFLFGSHSSDTAVETSDIDVMIVAENFDESDDLTVGKAWNLTRKVNTRIEPFLIGVDRFNKDTTSPLIDLVKSEGIQVF